MQKSVLYIRVSSKEQKQEGYSIPAQKKLLREYAKANSFKIVKEFDKQRSDLRSETFCLSQKVPTFKVRPLHKAGF